MVKIQVYQVKLVVPQLVVYPVVVLPQLMVLVMHLKWQFLLHLEGVEVVVVTGAGAGKILLGPAVAGGIVGGVVGGAVGAKVEDIVTEATEQQRGIVTEATEQQRGKTTGSVLTFQHFMC